MKLRYRIPLVVIGLLASCYACLRLMPEGPAAIRLTIDNDIPAGVLIDAIEIAGQTQAWPSQPDNGRPRVEPQRSWNGRFVTEATGSVPMVVRMNRLDTGEVLEARGMVEPLTDLACPVFIRSLRRDPIRWEPCTHNLDSDYPN